MKRNLWFGALAIALAAIVASGCVTAIRGKLNEAGASEISAVLKRYQAATYDAMLANAAKKRATVLEERGAKVVAYQADGVLEKPVPQRKLREYDEAVAKIDSDVKLITDLQAEADAVGAPTTPPTPLVAAP